jgi:hypothetical protein
LTCGNEEAERRFATEHILNCSVTHYELEDGRLTLRDAGAVYWAQEPFIDDVQSAKSH